MNAVSVRLLVGVLVILTTIGCGEDDLPTHAIVFQNILDRPALCGPNAGEILILHEALDLEEQLQLCRSHELFEFDGEHEDFWRDAEEIRVSAAAENDVLIWGRTNGAFCSRDPSIVSSATLTNGVLHIPIWLDPWRPFYDMGLPRKSGVLS